MYLVDGTVVTSASDLKKASECEFAFLRALDAKLGRIEPVPEPPKTPCSSAPAAWATSTSTACSRRYRAAARRRPSSRSSGPTCATPTRSRRGRRHARRVRRGRARRVPGHVRRRRASSASPTSSCASPTAATSCRTPSSPAAPGSPRCCSSRPTPSSSSASACRAPTRSSSCSATAPTSVHRLDDIAPVYRLRRAPARADRRRAPRRRRPGRLGRPALRRSTGAARRATSRCRRTATCCSSAGLRVTQRAALLEAGITTIDALAASDGPVPGILDATLENLRIQARLQLEAEAAQPSPRRPGCARPTTRRSRLPWSCATPRRSRRSPSPTPATCSSTSRATRSTPRAPRTDWGLDYLFGMVDTDERFTPLWAHTLRRGARGARAVPRARRRAPRGAPEHAHLPLRELRAHAPAHDRRAARRRRGGRRPAARRRRARRPLPHREAGGAGRQPLVLDQEARAALHGHRAARGRGEVGRRLDPRVRARPRAPRHGQLDPATGLVGAAAAQHVLDDLADYNRYDCVSTLRLRDWLLGIAREAGVEPVPESLLVEAAKAAGKVYEASPLAIELQRLAGPPDDPDRDADHTALALAAAAIDYHDREAKSFWWAHFFRVEQPLEAWEDHRDVLVVDPAASAWSQRWYREDQHRVDRRELLLRGRIAPGLAVRRRRRALRALRLPGAVPAAGPAPRLPHARTRCGCSRCSTTAWSSRSARSPGVTWSELPMAVVPGTPPPAGRQREAILEWAQELSSLYPFAWPRNPVDRRAAPHRRRARATARPASRRSPPTTTTSARSSPRCGRSTTPTSPCRARPAPARPTSHRTRITRLVAQHGWRIGVVAQSHAVVENVLDAVVARRARPRPRRQGAERRAASRATTGTRSSRKTASPSSRPSTRHPDSSSAAPHGTSRTPTACPAARSTCSSSTRPASSRSPSRSRRASPHATCCCSATRSSCRR